MAMNIVPVRMLGKMVCRHLTRVLGISLKSSMKMSMAKMTGETCRKNDIVLLSNCVSGNSVLKVCRKMFRPLVMTTTKGSSRKTLM